VEPYHARIRSALLHALPQERRVRHHRAIATALSGKGTAEQLARHWYGAGDVSHAATHARRAGDEARAKLDFDLSARWYAIALEGAQWTDDERRALRTQLGDALADAGHPREAADQFLAAAGGADASTALELRRRASGSLLQSGYIAEGLELTRAVLAAVGVKLPKTPLRALVSMLLRRAWLRIRGIGFKPRQISEFSQAELTRVDVCEGVSFGLALVDTFRSMDFGTRFLAFALKLGEPWRIARALALETDLLCAMAKGDRAMRTLARLEDITKTVDKPEAATQLTTTKAFVEFFVTNQFRTASDLFTEAIDRHRATVNRAGFELDTVLMFWCWTLYYQGQLGDLARRVPAMAEAAVRAGNRYTAVTLRCAFPIAWLARLEPDAIEAELDAALTSWGMPDGTYQMQHLFAMCSRIDLALYRGRPDDVTARIPGELKAVRRVMLDKAPMQGMLLYSSLARHALARAATAPTSSRRALIDEARRHVRTYRKLPVPLAGYSARMFDGLIAQHEGDTATAIACYRECLPKLESCDTHLFANAVRARLGELVGGDEGRDLVAIARTWLESEGVRNPEAVLQMLVPGPH
ncbi:MAG: hypothetical protein JO257_35315, partial [Deltaproteobacteria bacterium]|nr:hypothetical protein [Deltaproteobacteria bacterium]